MLKTIMLYIGSVIIGVGIGLTLGSIRTDDTEVIRMRLDLPSAETTPFEKQGASNKLQKITEDQRRELNRVYRSIGLHDRILGSASNV